MKCKNCSHEMFHPGGDAIEWACSWCGHFEWYPGFAERISRQPTKRATDEFCPRCKYYMPIDAVECGHCGLNVHQTHR